jgi:uncharacterized membrane protein (TIGR02234 family)
VNRTARGLGTALAALLVGGGLAILAASRPWNRIVVHRAAPLGPISQDVAGRTLEPAVTGLAVVALAGVIAVLATRGRVRVAVGGLLLVVGAVLIWPAAAGFSAVSDGRARSLVADARTGVVLDRATKITVQTQPVWPFLAIVGAVLVLAGGGVVAVRGRSWHGMSARYERATPVVTDPSELSPEDAARVRGQADLALWQSLERGEDPTA